MTPDFDTGLRSDFTMERVVRQTSLEAARALKQQAIETRAERFGFVCSRSLGCAGGGEARCCQCYRTFCTACHPMLTGYEAYCDMICFETQTKLKGMVSQCCSAAGLSLNAIIPDPNLER